MINLFHTLDKTEFLRDFWQRQPYLFRASATVEDIVTGDELAFLACDEQVESRIVLQEQASAGEEWQVEHGPFAEDRFATLPESHWTLMVQSVDQWLPELHQLLGAFDFIPRWRLDDILATYAVDGGGVGPHFDYYDVFLIQASGQRRWRLGQHCDHNSPLQANKEIKLLEQFDTSSDYTLNAGDILYVPPGVAHWGEAIGDDCITLSIGFRAPSQRDLIERLLEPLVECASDDKRFTDSLDSIESAHGEINAASQAGVVSLFEQFTEALRHDQSLQTEFVNQFASLVTAPRNLNIISAPDDADVATQLSMISALEAPVALQFDAVCRFAYIAASDKTAAVYLNGEAFDTSLAFAIALDQGVITPEAIASEREAALLKEWLQQGYLYLGDDTEQADEDAMYLS